jgi:hypothetical protein
MSVAFGRTIHHLLILNLLLQLFDGLLSYQVLSAGASEANSLVHTAIVNWGTISGLLYYKGLACVLLLMIFAFRHRRTLLTMQALTITATVYTCFGIACIWQLLIA